MNEVVVPWCRGQNIEVTRSRAYKKNDQAFVEQKNGAIVRRLIGYGRFEGADAARILARLYAASRLHTNFFQPSFKLKDKRREGAKVIKRYHTPATPYARVLAHPKLDETVKAKLREVYRTLDPVALLAQMRDAQAELGTRVDARAGKIASASIVAEPVDATPAITTPAITTPAIATAASLTAAFAKGLGNDLHLGEQRIIHRPIRKPYPTRMKMPSKLDPYLADIEAWLSAEPRITALAIVGRLAERVPEQFGPPQHSIVQRLLRSLRRKTASKIIASEVLQSALPVVYVPGTGGDAASHRHFALPSVPPIIREAAGAFKLNSVLKRRPSESNIAP
jgi:hypothetical protein